MCVFCVISARFRSAEFHFVCRSFMEFFRPGLVYFRTRPVGVSVHPMASCVPAARERAHRIKRVRRCRSLLTPRETQPEPRRLRERSTFEDTRGIGRDDPERLPTSNRAAFPASAQAGPHGPARSTSSDHLKGMVLDFHCSLLITQSLSQSFECFLFPSRHRLRR